MESLLRWGIENTPAHSESTDSAPRPSAPLDPGIIDAILGKPDAELMKEDIQFALDVSQSEEQRGGALDHLEMLVEQIDNANNLERLGIWERLQSLLLSESTPRSVVMHTLWVIGTALQNNPKAQDSYMKLNPLTTLLSFSTPGANSDIKIRAKVIYALSGLLKHNAPAVAKLDDPEIQGWKVIEEALRDPDIQTRRKTVFLLNSLLIPSDEHISPGSSDGNTATMHPPDTRPASSNAPVHPNSHADLLSSPSRANTSETTRRAIQDHRIISQLIRGLVEPVPHGEDGDIDSLDEGFEENSVRLIHTFMVSCRQTLLQADKEMLSTWIHAQYQEHGASVLTDRWGMVRQELEDFVSLFKIQNSQIYPGSRDT